MRLIVLGVLVTACSASAPDSPSESERAELIASICPTVTNPFFYSLSKDGKTSYLLGTRHVSVNLAKFPKHVHDAWAKATVLVVESDTITEYTGPATTVTSIEQALGADDYAKYRKLVGAQIADRQNARGVAMGIVSVITMFDDFDQQLDSELQREAKERKREVVHLETDEHTEEIADDDEMFGVNQLRKLLKMAPNRKIIRESTRHSLTLYCAGEWESDTLDFLDDYLVKGRNEEWIDRLDTMATERDGVFIAVGANHVIGPEGLIDMFQKRGFTLARNPESIPTPTPTPSPTPSPSPSTNEGSAQ